MAFIKGRGPIMSRDEVESLRKKGEAANVKTERDSAERLLGTLDNLVQIIQVNKDQIGGAFVVLVSKMGTVMVDPVDGDVSDGVKLQSGLNKVYTQALHAHAQSMLDGSAATEKSMREMMAHMFGGPDDDGDDDGDR